MLLLENKRDPHAETQCEGGSEAISDYGSDEYVEINQVSQKARHVAPLATMPLAGPRLGRDM